MRRTWASMSMAAVVLAFTAVPAFAQATGSSARPWHYWIAPFVLGGGVLLVIAVGTRYYFRVMSGRTRR